jgi:hypothetical protein
MDFLLEPCHDLLNHAVSVEFKVQCWQDIAVTLTMSMWT